MPLWGSITLYLLTVIFSFCGEIIDNKHWSKVCYTTAINLVSGTLLLHSV